MTDERREGDEAREALEATVSLSLRVLQAAMLVLAVLFLGSGFFTVEPHEVALVRRFGRVLETPERKGLQPGAHWAWPVLDEVVRVPALRTDRLATDAFALAITEAEAVSGKPPQRTGGLDPERDGYLLTGDANVVHATLAARYQIVDSYSFASKVRADDMAALVRPVLERAAVRAAAGRTVDELLTTKKDVFLEDVRRETQDALGKLGVGIRIAGVELARDLTPPPQVRDAFASVAKAVQDRDRIQSEARSEAAEASGRARAEAERTREGARSEAKRLLGDLDADVAVFQALLPEWQRDREGLEARLLADVLAKARPEEVYIIRPGEQTRVRLERDLKAVREELLRRAKGGK